MKKAFMVKKHKIHEDAGQNVMDFDSLNRLGLTLKLQGTNPGSRINNFLLENDLCSQFLTTHNFSETKDTYIIGTNLFFFFRKLE